MEYVVYRHTCPDTLLVRYVGMGQMGREKNRYDKRCLYKNAGIDFISEPIIEIVSRNLSKEDAIELEEFMIREYGRIRDDSGTLINIKFGTIPDEISKQKMRSSHLGRKDSDETKRIKSASAIGKKKAPFSDLHKARISEGAMGNTNVKGRYYITNGIDNKMIYPNDFIPDGWTKGRSTPWQSNK